MTGRRIFRTRKRLVFAVALITTAGDCSESPGTASQVTPQGPHRHANAGPTGPACGDKVGFDSFESATDSIQFYVFANLARHWYPKFELCPMMCRGR